MKKLQWIFERKRSVSDEHFKQNNTPRPDVCSMINRFPKRLLGRHVGHRSDGCFCLCNLRRVAEFGQTKIQDFDQAAGEEDDVGWFDIAMNDSVFVRLS